MKDHLLSECISSLPLGNIFLIRVHPKYVPALGSLYLEFRLLRTHFLKYPHDSLCYMEKDDHWNSSDSLDYPRSLHISNIFGSHGSLIDNQKVRAGGTTDTTYPVVPRLDSSSELPQKLFVSVFLNQQSFTGSNSRNLVQWIWSEAQEPIFLNVG